MTSDEQQKELEKLSWYRLLKVLAILFLIFVFILPFFQGKTDGGAVDGLVNVLVWGTILYFAKRALVYVKYGKQTVQKDTQIKQKQELTEKEKKEIEQYNSSVKRVFLILLISLLVFVTGASVYSSSKLNEPVVDYALLAEQKRAVRENTPIPPAVQKYITGIETENSVEAPIAPKKVWREVTSFEGTGVTETRPFNIKGNKWRISWKCDVDKNETERLMIWGQPIKGSAISSKMLDTTCPFSGVVEYEVSLPGYGYEPPGAYFLSIVSNNTSFNTHWKVVVEELI